MRRVGGPPRDGTAHHAGDLVVPEAEDVVQQERGPDTSGPPISTRPRRGPPTATSATNRATSALATGCTRPGGTGSRPYRAPTPSIAARYSWKWVARTTVHGTGPSITATSCAALTGKYPMGTRSQPTPRTSSR
ncbi:MAG TPA: hypothetical protein VGM12_16435 [Trebonia sp.]